MAPGGIIRHLIHGHRVYRLPLTEITGVLTSPSFIQLDQVLPLIVITDIVTHPFSVPLPIETLSASGGIRTDNNPRLVEYTVADL